MWGETVTISARVDKSLDSHGLILGNNKPIVGDRMLVVSQSELHDLVLLQTGPDVVLDRGDVVQVTGVVREYNPAELEASLGISLDEAALSGYGSQAVLVADAIDVDVPIASEAGDKEFTSGSSGYDFGITIDDILARPNEFLGMTVTVSDEVEEHLLTPHLFLLGDDALLCISATPHPELFVESTAYVTGEVRLFDLREIERRTGIDLDDAALRDFSGQPVVLVHSLVVVT